MKFIFIAFLFPLFVQAAPFPTTGSSAVNYPKWNTAFSQMGFTFKLVSDEWVFLENPSQNRLPANQQIDMGFKTLSESARLSLKTETYRGKVNLEAYAKKYLRDYNQYGFEVISSKSVKINGVSAVVIDLMQKNKLTQSRQIFLGADEKITIASCIDKAELFSMTSNMCNQLINNYNWRPTESDKNRL
ncbi:hypothetical protein CIK05_02320 [Bdellovibrio sp. qaytius]|nr:hypothetical protein CIK05_02320 [Bdellovibrio sp. qaytius]